MTQKELIKLYDKYLEDLDALNDARTSAALRASIAPDVLKPTFDGFISWLKSGGEEAQIREKITSIK